MNSKLKPHVLLIQNQPMTTTVAVAGHFEKEHFHVLRDIQLVIQQQEDKSFTDQHFIVSSYDDAHGRSKPMFRLTEMGFTLLAMGFTGAKAAKWKRVYGETFLAMRSTLADKDTRSLKKQLDDLTRDHYDELGRVRARIQTAEYDFDHIKKLNVKLKQEKEVIEYKFNSLQIQHALTEQILKDGFTGGSAETEVIYLKGLVGELAADSALADHRRDEQVATALAARVVPDYSTYCSSKTYIKILCKFNHCLGDASVLAGLIHERAFDEAAVVHSHRLPLGTTLGPHKTIMDMLIRRIEAAGLVLFPREVLHQAAVRLQKKGFVVISEQVPLGKTRPVRLYQVRLKALLAFMEQPYPDEVVSEVDENGDVRSAPHLEPGITMRFTSRGSLTSPVMLIEEFEHMMGVADTRMLLAWKDKKQDELGWDGKGFLQ